MHWQATMSWQMAQKKARLLSDIRIFFATRDVIEVETPLLSQGTVTDVYLDAFSTRYQFLLNETDTPLFLQTSPEFAMKRLLASGYGSIYQLCKAFRDEPYGMHHNPEFTILEWYRLDFDYHELMDEVSLLLVAVLGCSPAIKVSYQEVFINKVNIDPLATSKAECLRVIHQRGIYSSWLDNENLDTLLQFIFTELIEKHIGDKQPCFVFDFPATQASLAKLNESDNRVAKRFECYYQGIELLNGFEELTDAEEQLKRFKKDNQLRLEQNLPARAIDEHFIAALQSGLPNCSGVAIGVDRLFMLQQQLFDIQHAITFNIENA